jgi:hypothetical protein
MSEEMNALSLPVGGEKADYFLVNIPGPASV